MGFKASLCLKVNAKQRFTKLHGYTMHQHGADNIQHFNFQLTYTTLKNVELLKHFKISKTAPTCFSLQGKHHQGATIST